MKEFEAQAWLRLAKKLEVLVLNPIAQVGLKRLPAGAFEVVKESKAPDVILVRSADMHAMKFDARLKAVGRAGAGVNNIPVQELSKLGVPVFNAPGANANAVKELVVAGNADRGAESGSCAWSSSGTWIRRIRIWRRK